MITNKKETKVLVIYTRTTLPTSWVFGTQHGGKLGPHYQQWLVPRDKGKNGATPATEQKPARRKSIHSRKILTKETIKISRLRNLIQLKMKL